MSLIPSNCPKPDLFIFQAPKQAPIDVTNYKIDDFLNLYEQKDSELEIICLYQSYNFSAPIVNSIRFGIEENPYLVISYISSGSVLSNEVSYDNKPYYYYENFS